jgi:hypothetical protein
MSDTEQPTCKRIQAQVIKYQRLANQWTIFWIEHGDSIPAEWSWIDVLEFYDAWDKDPFYTVTHHSATRPQDSTNQIESQKLENAKKLELLSDESDLLEVAQRFVWDLSGTNIRNGSEVGVFLDNNRELIRGLPAKCLWYAIYEFFNIDYSYHSLLSIARQHNISLDCSLGDWEPKHEGWKFK